MIPNSKCAVLVPYINEITTECELSLRELERRGYPVKRVRGFSQIDVARNVIASEALRDGYEETLWIDSDIGFSPDDVDHLRLHQLPVVCGLYPKKGRRQYSCKFLPDTREVNFGVGGGLLRILYAAAGFLLVQSHVYETVRQQLQLPVCNQMFGEEITPWFQPLVRPYRNGHWYLGEDFAFCERLRLSEIPVFADTTIRLSHFGQHGFTWEESGSEVPRYSSYIFRIHPDEGNS